ncbi:MAG: amino acid adenylation domain-containing protein [Acidobacteriota bacterium]
MTILAHLARAAFPRVINLGLPLALSSLFSGGNGGDDAVEDSYPLSPLQAGMLFHTLLAPGSGVDVIQEVSDFDEELDLDAFEEAWKRVAGRHPALRTGFQWEGLESPVQEVRSALPFLERRDWQSMSREDQNTRMNEYLVSDRLHGFDLRQPPLMRLAIFRFAPSAFRFVWTFHHALLDGWGIPLVLREVFITYEAIRIGQVPVLPDAIPYRDYIAWLQSVDLSGAESLWRRSLEGFRVPTSIGLPPSPSPAVREGPPHGEEEIRLSETLTSALRSLGRRYEVTLGTILQGAWACLLSRYSGDQDVVFGVTRQCRSSDLARAGTALGLFINTLPLRAHMAPGSTALDLLRELRSQWIHMGDLKHTPLTDIQRWSDVPRDVPLFETIVVYEPSLVNSTLRAHGGEWSRRTFEYFSQPNTPLNVVGFGEPGLVVRISYDRARFDTDTVRRMLGHLETLMEGIAENIETPVHSLPMLTAGERQQILDWNVPSAFPSTGFVHREFEAQVRQRPDATAVEFQDSALSYSELNRRANRLARRLRRARVASEVLVGICLDRSLDLVVAILAVMKAGGAYLPLDPEYPEERLAFMASDSGMSVLVTDERLETLVHVGPDVTVCLMEEEAGPKIAEEELDLDATGSPDNLAYVIYTSGSTGKPKGVLVTHRSVDRLFAATESWFHFDERDVWTLFHSFAFDFSVWELWGALRHGGRLVVVPREITRSPAEFRSLLSERRITVLNQTPSAFRQCVQADALVETALNLRLVIFGGEALDSKMLVPWFERHGAESPRLVNMYGITETTVHVTAHPLSLSDAGGTDVIGRPIPDLRVYVLNPALELCPIGVTGEIHVGGPGVARGYLGRPELTAERFIPDSISSIGSERLYRSGDRGRYRANGDIEYLGRQDQQVKIRGHRVELGEIESALEKHPGVREAVVVAREDVPGDVRLTGYVVAAETRFLLPDLRRLLKSSLPVYMLPSRLVVLDRLPLTQNGKLNRDALPVALEGHEEREGFIAPRNPVEEAVSKIWSEILGQEGLGANDDFFERGGHSLMATQVGSRVRDVFGVEMPIRTLFDCSRVDEFARAISALGARQRPTEIRRLDRSPAAHLRSPE